MYLLPTIENKLNPPKKIHAYKKFQNKQSECDGDSLFL